MQETVTGLTSMTSIAPVKTVPVSQSLDKNQLFDSYLVAGRCVQKFESYLQDLLSFGTLEKLLTREIALRSTQLPVRKASGRNELETQRNDDKAVYFLVSFDAFPGRGSMEKKEKKTLASSSTTKLCFIR